MTVLTWSDDRVEQLKKLWEAGLSASQIAAELGNVTRNAVIGKVHRLGLSGRAKSPSSAAPRPRKARPAQHMMRVSRPVSRGNTALAHAFEVELEPDPIAYDNVVPMSQRLSLLGIERGHLSLAGRRSLEPGIFLLRRQGADQPALLRAPLADRLSADRRPAPPGAEDDAVMRSFTGRGARSGALLRAGTDQYFQKSIRPSRSDRRARSPRRARCGSDPAPGRG